MPHSKAVKTWIVVADAARARFIEQPGRNEPLKVVEEREHGASRALSSEIASDGKGRTFDSAGQGRHAMEPPTDPQRHEKTKFTKELAEAINHAAKTHRFDRLVIACPAQMLGELRRELDKPASEKVTGEIAKDLSKLSLHELPGHFAEHVTVPDPREHARQGRG